MRRELLNVSLIISIATMATPLEVPIECEPNFQDAVFPEAEVLLKKIAKKKIAIFFSTFFWLQYFNAFFRDFL